MERYEKQILFEDIGESGQMKLLNKKVVIIGCGALGTVIANNLVRSGIGHIRIVDRDYIELSNLQRQILFDEDDIKNNLPKVIAAKRKLEKINSSITIEAIIEDVNSKNILDICKGFDLILDATDNMRTRYLINDISVKLNIPWVYGGVVASSGMVHSIIPNITPCLKCLFPNEPPIGSVDTCDTVGVLNPITSVVASIESMEALKILTENQDKILKGLLYIDLWENEFQYMDISISVECEVCKNKDFKHLDTKMDEASILCGKNSIQINPLQKSVSMDNIKDRLDNLSIEWKHSKFFLKFTVENVQFTLFNDGRAILKNIDDINKAKTLYYKYIGN